MLGHIMSSWSGCLHSFRPSEQNMPWHSNLSLVSELTLDNLKGNKDSQNPEFTLYGTKYLLFCPYLRGRHEILLTLISPFRALTFPQSEGKKKRPHFIKTKRIWRIPN